MMDGSKIPTLIVLLITIILNLPQNTDAVALTFELPDKETMCFYEKFTKGEKYVLLYKVIKGGNDDVDVTIYSPKGKEIYKGEKEHEDTVNFEVSRGIWKFCFEHGRG